MKKISIKIIKFLCCLINFALPTRAETHSEKKLVMNFKYVMLKSLSHEADKIIVAKDIKIIEIIPPITIPILNIKKICRI